MPCPTCEDNTSTFSEMDWGPQGFKIRNDHTFMVAAPHQFAGWKGDYGAGCGCGCGCRNGENCGCSDTCGSGSGGSGSPSHEINSTLVDGLSGDDSGVVPAITESSFREFDAPTNRREQERLLELLALHGVRTVGDLLSSVVGQDAATTTQAQVRLAMRVPGLAIAPMYERAIEALQTSDYPLSYVIAQLRAWGDVSQNFAGGMQSAWSMDAYIREDYSTEEPGLCTWDRSGRIPHCDAFQDGCKSTGEPWPGSGPWKSAICVDSIHTRGKVRYHRCLCAGGDELRKKKVRDRNRSWLDDWLPAILIGAVIIVAVGVIIITDGAAAGEAVAEAEEIIGAIEAAEAEAAAASAEAEAAAAAAITGGSDEIG